MLNVSFAPDMNSLADLIPLNLTKNMKPLKAYRILVICYCDGELRRLSIIACDCPTAETIAELRYGDVVG
jgi:hypothetical protein